MAPSPPQDPPKAPSSRRRKPRFWQWPPTCCSCWPSLLILSPLLIQLQPPWPPCYLLECSSRASSLGLFTCHSLFLEYVSPRKLHAHSLTPSCLHPNVTSHLGRGVGGRGGALTIPFKIPTTTYSLSSILVLFFSIDFTTDIPFFFFLTYLFSSPIYFVYCLSALLEC